MSGKADVIRVAKPLASRLTTTLAMDIDKWACATFRANFPDTEVRQASVADEIANLREGQADIITGGFPCQPHSFAGKREASADARDCGPDFVAAIAKVKPRMFLGENVEGILSSEGGRYVSKLVRAMEDAGYVLGTTAQPVCIADAVSFGVPQFRVRAWFWGIRRDLYVDGVRHQWPKRTHAWPPPLEDPDLFGLGKALLHYSPGVTVGQALGLDHDVRRIRGSGVERRDHQATEPCTTIAGTHLGTHQGAQNPRVKLYSYSDAMLQKHPPASPASPAPTVMGKWFKGGAEGLLQWKQTKDGLWVRRLHPLECARLQSMPDDFIWPEGITKTAMYRIVGNGQASKHVAAISLAMQAADPDSHSIIDLFCGGGLGACGMHQRYWSYERDVLGLEAA